MTSIKQSKSRSEGEIRQRPNGSWQIVFALAPDTKGKRNRKYETVKGSKKEAQKVLRQRLQERDEGRSVNRSKETVQAYIERWLIKYVAKHCTARTEFGYRTMLTRYIHPAIGNVQLQSLKMTDIQAMYDDMQSEPRNLSASTVTQLHNVFKQALNHAVMDGILQRNPAEYIKPPKKVRAKFEAWELETILEFLELTADTRYGHFYKFAVLTGMRRSEICGLKWNDIKLSDGYLNVVRTLQYIKGRGMIEQPPKSFRSDRAVRLSPDVIDLLHSIKGKQMLHQVAIGDHWQGSDYVFTNVDGSPLNGDSVTQEFKRLVRKHNLPDMKLHGLRHAFASLALSADVNPKIVSETLGHSTTAITLNIYSHILKPKEAEAVNSVANLLSGSK